MNIHSAVVEKLILSQFPSWANLSLKEVKSAGTDNALFRLGSTMVVRVPRTLSAAKQADKEVLWLPKLAPFLPLAIPRLIAQGMPDENMPWKWFIYEWIEGADASVATVNEPNQDAIILAQFLTALHSLDSLGGPAPGEHNFYRGEPLINRDAATRYAIETLQDTFDKDKMINAWERAVQAPVWNNVPCWIHGDLLPTNILVHQGRVSAVIDFGGLGVGDPACDLLVAWSYLSHETRKAFRDTLFLDDASWERGRGWALTFGLSAYGYYKITNPVLAGIGKRAVNEVLLECK
jgi:aminoglycoside phosphotransferase (APT) family kinase protein